MTTEFERRYCRGRFYRDRENGLFFGVCAGFAELFDFRVMTVRILTVVALLLFFWPTVAVYMILAWLLKDRPLKYRGREDEYRFWRKGSPDGWR